MKTKKLLVILISVLCIFTAVLAGLYLTSREQIPEGALAVSYQGNTVYADVDSLNLQSITGTIVNGKGEEKQVNATGIEVAVLLESLDMDPANICSVVVMADDAFSARVTAEEIKASGKVFLSREDEGFTLIVFGDSDSKRNVRKVVKLEVA